MPDSLKTADATKRDLAWRPLVRFAGWGALVVVGLLVGTWLVAYGLSSKQERHATRQVELHHSRVMQALGPRTARPVPAPPAPPSPQQQQLDSTLAALGVKRDVSVAPTPALAEDLAKPGSIESPLARETQGWLFKQLQKPQVAIDAPSDAVATYLRDHRNEYDALADATAQGGIVSVGERPWEVSLLLQVVLADGLLCELEGDHARATRRVESAARAAATWLRVVPLLHRPIAVTPLDLALVAVRKLQSPGGWVDSLRPDDLRAEAAQAVDERAAQILRDAREGDASRVLFYWGVQPSMSRVVMLPLYRRRLAQGAELLAARAEAIASGTSRETNEQRQERWQAFNAPPLGPVPGVVRETVLGLQLADLSESRTWPMAQESDGAADLDDLLDDLAATRVVLALRAEADAQGGCWPSSLHAGSEGFVLLPAASCAVRVARVREGGEPELLFEAP